MPNREQQLPPPVESSRFDPDLVNQLKKEVFQDLKARQEWQEKLYGEFEEYDGKYPGNPPAPGYGLGWSGPGYGYGGRGPGAGMGMGPGRTYGWCPWPPPPMARNMALNRKPPVFDHNWWTDREEYDYQRNMTMLRKQVMRELEGVNRVNQRMAQVRDPQVRLMLQEILQEAWQMGMDTPELMQSISNTNNMNPYNNMPRQGASVSDRVSGFFRGLDRRSFGLGAGAGLLGLLFFPSLTKSFRPMVRKAMEEAMDVSQRAQGVFARAKEEFDDIVAEAGFNKMKESVEKQMDGAEENEPPSK